MITKLLIKGKPVTKKNSQRILVNSATGQRFIAPSAQYKQYEKDAAFQLSKQFSGRKPIDSPVNISCEFFMPTSRKVDLTNLLEAADDVLVKAGVIADDNSNIVAGHDGSRVWIDREKPRTEITISKMRY